MSWRRKQLVLLETKAPIIKTMWYFHMKRKEDQRNLGNPEKDQNMYGNAMKTAFQNF